MIKYFITFGMICLCYNILKLEVMISGCFVEGISQARITRIRFLQIPSGLINSSICTIFILFLLLFVKAFLVKQAQPQIFNNIGYERIVKEMKIILSCGVLLMITTIILNNKEIQQFGKQILLVTNKSGLLKLANYEMEWQSEIRNVWEASAFISCTIFGIRLCSKLRVNLHSSILISIIIFLCLSTPFYNEIYQSLKNIIK